MSSLPKVCCVLPRFLPQLRISHETVPERGHEAVPAHFWPGYPGAQGRFQERYSHSKVPVWQTCFQKTLPRDLGESLRFLGKQDVQRLSLRRLDVLVCAHGKERCLPSPG